MRRSDGWRMAARLPQTIEMSGNTAKRSAIGDATVAVPNTRTIASNTPALMTVAMYAVTGTLAPSYASGAHAWNGTIAALRKNASNTSTTAARDRSVAPSAAPNTPTFIDPLAP